MLYYTLSWKRTVRYSIIRTRTPAWLCL